MAEVQFTFICEKRFDDLEGEDDLIRFCGGCQRRVLNLDRLDDDQQQTVLGVAASSPIYLCVAATVPLSPCSDRWKQRMDSVVVGNASMSPYYSTGDAELPEEVKRFLEEESMK